VAEFEYLGTIVTNPNCILREVKSRLNLGNVCYSYDKNLLSSCLLSKNIKIKRYSTVILLIILYGYEMWSLTLRNID